MSLGDKPCELGYCLLAAATEQVVYVVLDWVERVLLEQLFLGISDYSGIGLPECFALFQLSSVGVVSAEFLSKHCVVGIIVMDQLVHAAFIFSSYGPCVLVEVWIRFDELDGVTVQRGGAYF